MDAPNPQQRYTNGMQKRSLILLSVLFLLPFSSNAEEINAGFVQGLWYSSETVFEGVPTRIYVALRNNTPHDLTGTVRFTDNDKRIGSSEVSALSGRLVEAWIDWTPGGGEHKISATLSDASLHIIGGGTEQIDITNIIAEDALVIDTDTDKDGIGNATDTDDDGDTISDTDEKTRGSNPLVKNPTPVATPEEKTETEPDLEKEKIKSAVETSVLPEKQGLEQYVDEGTTDTLLSSATKKVTEAKESLDDYREKRNAELSVQKVETPKESVLTTASDNATITRSKIETKNSFLNSFVTTVATLMQKAWTFALWLASRALAFPALIELAFLISILYFFYRAARSVGRRPN